MGFRIQSLFGQGYGVGWGVSPKKENRTFFLYGKIIYTIYVEEKTNTDHCVGTSGIFA